MFGVLSDVLSKQTRFRKWFGQEHHLLQRTINEPVSRNQLAIPIPTKIQLLFYSVNWCCVTLSDNSPVLDDNLHHELILDHQYHCHYCMFHYMPNHRDLKYTFPKVPATSFSPYSMLPMRVWVQTSLEPEKKFMKRKY